MTSIFPSSEAAAWCDGRRARGQKIVWTNGCFDILHAGHVELLQHARTLGDCLIVGINSDASVKRLKGESRPINDEQARAFVLAALACVDAVCIYEDDTPIPVLEDVRPSVHVKGGDYRVEDLPEAAIVQKHGGEIVIVPLRQGFSTTNTLQKLNEHRARCLIVVPARYGSTRFPGKMLANLGRKTVIEHVVERALQTQVDRPILVATDDNRIARQIAQNFEPQQVRVVMTSADCETGTDRIAQAVIEYSNEQGITLDERLIIVNVQGDEPFVDKAHLDILMQAMRNDATLQMATLATPIADESQIEDPNVVKVVCDNRGNALYFSRCSIPFERDAKPISSTEIDDATSKHQSTKLRHLGVYAYDARWLLKMAQMPPSRLEQIEKLEQLRALENGVTIQVLEAQNVVNIAIDTPQDLVAAQQYLKNL